MVIHFHVSYRHLKTPLHIPFHTPLQTVVSFTLDCSNFYWRTHLSNALIFSLYLTCPPEPGKSTNSLLITLTPFRFKKSKLALKTVAAIKMTLVLIVTRELILASIFFCSPLISSIFCLLLYFFQKAHQLNRLSRIHLFWTSQESTFFYSVLILSSNYKSH